MALQNNLTNQISTDISTTPDAKNNVALQAQASKELATVQGQIFMAKQYPREMDVVMRKIQSMCERQSLAKSAEYEYTRGGTKVSGASIRLVEAIAQAYGNITWSWKEVSRVKGVSSVIAYAWDLETNTRTEIGFDVVLKRDTKEGSKEVTAERDIYELIASNAQRRVRKCLEGAIPRDIIDQAREWCDETLTSKVDIQAGIDKAINYFNEQYGVTLQRIEAKYNLKRRAFTKNTYLSLQKAFTSVRDGVAPIDEVFPPINNVGKGNVLSEDKAKAEPQTKEQPVVENTLLESKDGQAGFNFEE